MTGKERIDYLLGLGSSLAPFGSLIGRISTCVEMYFHNCMVPLKLHSKILHAISWTFSYLLVCLLICLFIHSLTSVSLFDFQDRPFGKLSGHHCSTSFQGPVGLLSSNSASFLLKVTQRNRNRGLPSLGALEY